MHLQLATTTEAIETMKGKMAAMATEIHSKIVETTRNGTITTTEVSKTINKANNQIVSKASSKVHRQSSSLPRQHRSLHQTGIRSPTTKFRLRDQIRIQRSRTSFLTHQAATITVAKSRTSSDTRHSLLQTKNNSFYINFFIYFIEVILNISCSTLFYHI